MSERELSRVSTDRELSEAIRHAFGQYSLERPLEELLEHPRRRRGSSLRRVARALAVSGLAAAAVLLAALWPGGGQDTAVGPAPDRAFASWTPTPRPADSDSLAAAVARCDAADPRGGELPIATTKQRGAYTLVFRTDRARRAACIAGPRDQLLSLPAPPKLPASELSPEPPGSFAIEEVFFPGPRNPLAGQVGLVLGRVGPRVGGVEISPDHGRPLTATVTRGYFVAWWPGTAEDAAHATIRARDRAGSQIAAFRLLARDASLAELARNPSALESLPAELSGTDGSGQHPIMSLLTPHQDFSREIAVYLSATKGADGTVAECQEFATDEQWKAASPSLQPKCRYPSR